VGVWSPFQRARRPRFQPCWRSYVGIALPAQGLTSVGEILTKFVSFAHADPELEPVSASSNQRVHEAPRAAQEFFNRAGCRAAVASRDPTRSTPGGSRAWSHSRTFRFSSDGSGRRSKTLSFHRAARRPSLSVGNDRRRQSSRAHPRCFAAFARSIRQSGDHQVTSAAMDVRRA